MASVCSRQLHWMNYDPNSLQPVVIYILSYGLGTTMERAYATHDRPLNSEVLSINKLQGAMV